MRSEEEEEEEEDKEASSSSSGSRASLSAGFTCGKGEAKMRSLEDPRRGEGGGETWAELGLSGMWIGGQTGKVMCGTWG